MQRNRICVLTAMPEALHEQRILDGIFAQCQTYGYHVAVFATMTNLMHNDRAYQQGEEAIYQLPNFDLFDGVIVDTLTFGGGYTQDAMGKIASRMQKECRKPVVCLELPMNGYPVVENDNENVLREMCRHLTDFHGKRDICILTGGQGNPVAEYRLEIFLDELAKHGIEVPPERIVYGDFWYTSGEALAEEIAAGERTMPEAFLCASDHMALGLIERLKRRGYAIPRDAIVIGFEATVEAALNETPLTSYKPNDTLTAARAVDHLRRIIEPDAEVIPFTPKAEDQIHFGESCGCSGDIMRSVAAFRDALYYTMHNYNLETRKNNIDIGLLMENYISERLTAADTPHDCLYQIWTSSYILRPMMQNSLCLAENWLTDYTHNTDDPYPPKMRLVCAYSDDLDATFFDDPRCVLFDTKDMLPQMLNDTGEPSVYYFSPVHFGDKTLGYTVLQRRLTDPHKINLVYRNWLRMVNNSLEMMRAKQRYVLLSSHDEMTGLLNRRGFFEQLPKRLSARTEDGYSMAMLSVDLDGLKHINDTYGHSEGDRAIRTVALALRSAVENDGICARFGGDEFEAAVFLPTAELRAWYESFLTNFRRSLAEFNETAGKPYTVGASIGFASDAVSPSLIPDTLMNQADERMYADKIARKAQRVF
ncbi:MAG: GGDEF domain-containing protein [Oscillospiraceae bacterium]|nr:GGDEF domain-containing protein [Oscillospiraceae bacterium]